MLNKYSQASYEFAIPDLPYRAVFFQSRVNLLPMEHLEMLGDIGLSQWLVGREYYVCSAQDSS